MAVEEASRGRVCALTIAYHPELERVGERAFLFATSPARRASLSRTEPHFFAPGARDGRALDDRHLSRRPLWLRIEEDRLTIDASESPTAIHIGGVAVDGKTSVSGAELDAGVLLELGDRVVLVVHRARSTTVSTPAHGLVGVSDGLEQVRTEIERVAPEAIPVLLRGESGVGKELVARAIHDASACASGPYVAVNMAALPSTTAASELFGHEKGAFTGALQRHRGYFEAAEGGTLFLDEIGALSLEVQSMLLRAIESKEVQPLGASRPRRVHVRLLAATDSDLEHSVNAGTFRLPLLHRLAAYEIAIPPLRSRRDDIAPLLLHFLKSELDPEVLRFEWLPAALVARLVRCDWPGNVRQLRNVARQLVIASRGEDRVRMNPAVERLLEGGAAPLPDTPAEEPLAPPRPTPADLSSISDDRVVEVLEQTGWHFTAAARELGVSKTSMYQLVARSKRIRKAKDLTREEILDAQRECDGDLAKMAARLSVSRRGLKLRMTTLGIA